MSDQIKVETPLTRDRVIEICGRLDDMRIAAIIATGAVASELRQARTLQIVDDYPARLRDKIMTPRVAKLIDMLRAADEPEWDDR